MLWIKAFHIIAVICWFAGLFYLPRLFVYHALSEDQISQDRFVVMERKLFWAITTPAGILAVVLGAWLLLLNADYYLAYWWMHIKLLLVLGVIAYHFICWRMLVAFRERRASYSQLYLRVFNELPVFLLIGIVVLIVVKP